MVSTGSRDAMSCRTALLPKESSGNNTAGRLPECEILIWGVIGPWSCTLAG